MLPLYANICVHNHGLVCHPKELRHWSARRNVPTLQYTKIYLHLKVQRERQLVQARQKMTNPINLNTMLEVKQKKAIRS